ncbi:hypothetical protein A6E02_08045 [Aliivibrio fischeri]|nr:hypothetical protein A6E02_08045 [Aliivibrio fischeri]
MEDIKVNKWHQKKSSIMLLIFIIGPLALPFVWMSPEITLKWKTVATIGLIVLSYFSYQSYLEMVLIADTYMQLFQL